MLRHYFTLSSTPCDFDYPDPTIKYLQYFSSFRWIRIVHYINPGGWHLWYCRWSHLSLQRDHKGIHSHFDFSAHYFICPASWLHNLYEYFGEDNHSYSQIDIPRRHSVEIPKSSRGRRSGWSFCIPWFRSVDLLFCERKDTKDTWNSINQSKYIFINLFYKK